jgi:hypothetical protein
MKLTRQVVRTIKQSILLRCIWVRLRKTLLLQRVTKIKLWSAGRTAAEGESVTATRRTASLKRDGRPDLRLERGARPV